MKANSPELLKRLLWLGLVGVVINTGSVSGQGVISLQPFAEIGESAPGTPNAWTAFVANASLSANNTISFAATAGGSGAGVWYGTPGSLSLAGLAGAAAPGTADSFLSFDATLTTNAGGGVASARLSGGDDGVWSFFGGGTSLVASEGLPAPGTGARFSIFNTVAGNDSGDVAILSVLDTAPNRAIHSTPGGVLTLRARSGDLVGAGGPLAAATYSAFITSGIGLSNAGRISFGCVVSGAIPATSNHALVSLPTAGAAELVALRGNPAPSSGGFSFSTFSGSLINDNDDVVFRATLDAGAPVTANTGLWHYADATTTLTKIVQEGDAATGTANFFGSTFEEWFVPNDGAVAFVSGTVNGAAVSQGRGVWYDPDGPGVAPLELVAVVGGNAFDTDGTTILGTVSQILNVGMNRAGDMMLRMSLTAGGGTGVWVRSAGAGNSAALYLRTGDIVAGSDRSLRSVSNVLGTETAGFTELGGGPVGRSNVLAESGEPLVHLYLDGSERGLYLPTQGSLAFFVAGADGDVPDGAGAPTGNAYDSIRPAGTINENGLTAFRGHLQLGVGDAVSGTEQGIWTEVAGLGDPVNTLVARRGDPAPVGTFNTIYQNPVFNDNGEVAFASEVTGTTGTTAIFRGSPGSLETLAVSGQGSPLLTNGEVFLHVRQGYVSLNNSGRVAAFASLVGDPATMVTKANDSVLLRLGSLPRLIAREGDAATGSPAGVVFDDLRIGKPAIISSNSHVVFSARRRVNLGAGITSANQYGIWYHNGTSRSVVAAGGLLAGGLTLLKPEDPVLNDGNRVAFYSTLQGSPDVALFLTNAGGGGAAPIVRTNVAQPDPLGPAGIAAGATFASVGRPVIGAIGAVPQVGFQGNLTVGDGGVTAADDSGVWVDDGTNCRLVAREGNFSPDATGAASTAVFNSFSSITMSSTGRVALTGNLQIGVGGVTAASDNGLWAENSSGALVLVAREGTSYNIPVAGGGTRNVTVRSFSIPGTPLGGAGVYKGYSGSGFLVGHLTFTDGTTGALVFLIP